MPCRLPIRLAALALAGSALSGCLGLTYGSNVHSTDPLAAYTDGMNGQPGVAFVRRPAVNVGSGGLVGLSVTGGGEEGRERVGAVGMLGVLTGRNTMTAEALGADSAAVDALTLETRDVGLSFVRGTSPFVVGADLFVRRSSAERTGITGAARGSGWALVARPVVGVVAGRNLLHIIGLVGLDVPLGKNDALVPSASLLPASGLGERPVRGVALRPTAQLRVAMSLTDCGC